MTRDRRFSHSGFTLVELLTVIAIIGVLATLLSTALGTAKRKARQTACTSNLRQISLALNMYLEDQEKRPTNLSVLVATKYLSAAGVLRCLEDRTGNWGGLIETPGLNSPVPPTLIAPAKSSTALTDLPSAIPYSYLHPLPWENSAWDRLMKSDPSAGIAVCQLHGLGKQNFSFPSIRDFEGLILRAQRDGAVVRRQIFWERAQAATRQAVSGGVSSAVSAPTMAAPPLNDSAQAAPDTSYPWQLFTDEPIP